MKAKRARAIAEKGRRLKQVGALPFRLDAAGNVHFLLITSRSTKRFIIPKGWRMKKVSDAKAAAAEAGQEAGVAGKVSKQAIGRYFYWKRIKKAFIPVNVEVFPLHVHVEQQEWRERQQRRRAWVSSHQAISLIDEPQLVRLLTHAAVTLGAGR